MERIPCTDENCTGIINEQGYCGVCGKPKPDTDSTYNEYEEDDVDDYDAYYGACSIEEVEEQFWERNEEKCKGSSQYRPLLKALLNKARKLRDEQDLDVDNYEKQLAEAEEILDDITFSLRGNWKDAPKGKFWWGWGNNLSHEKPKEWGLSPSPIDSYNLDSATAKYFTKQWMQHNKLDWYILNGFIVDEILRLADNMRTGEAFGENKFIYNLSYSFADGKPFPTTLWRLGLNTFFFFFGWLLLPLIVVLAYIYDYPQVAKWVAIVFGCYLLYKIVILPWRIIHWRNVRRLKKLYVKKLQHLIEIYILANGQTMNPSVLRKKIEEFEKEGMLVKPAVYSILDRAIQRDPAVFVAD